MAELGFNEYQNFTESTAIYNDSIDKFVDSLGIQDVPKANRLRKLLKITYTVLGLVGEAGELANKLKKVIRDNEGYLEVDKRADMAAEGGDVQYYLAQFTRQLDANLADVVVNNINKLNSRKDRGVLGGSGDNR